MATKVNPTDLPPLPKDRPRKRQRRLGKEAKKKAAKKRAATASKHANRARNRRKKVERLDAEIEKREKTLEAMKSAPTPAKQRQILFAKFEEFDFDPIDTMIEYAQNKNVPMKDRVNTAKELASLAYAKPKSIDVQGELSSEVHVHVMDFGNLTQKQLKQAHPAHAAIEAEIADTSEDDETADEYDEFIGPEDRRAEEGLEQEDIEI